MKTGRHSRQDKCLVAAVVGTGQRRRGVRGRNEGKGISAYVDGSPSKGRVRKALRPQGTTTMAGNPLFGQRRDDIYESIVDKASKLFVVIRQSVVCDLAPSALKASFLDPLHSTLFSEVCDPRWYTWSCVIASIPTCKQASL
jgi:hypothetical protein